MLVQKYPMVCLLVLPFILLISLGFVIAMSEDLGSALSPEPENNAELQPIFDVPVAPELSVQNSSDSRVPSDMLIPLENFSYFEVGSENVSEPSFLENTSLVMGDDFRGSSTDSDSPETFVPLETLLIDGENQQVTDNGAVNDADGQGDNSSYKYVLYDNRKVVLEADVSLEQNPSFSYSQEVVSDGPWVSEVVVSSAEHFSAPLTVYADVNSADKENVRVYWMTNEGMKDITDNSSFNVKFIVDDSGTVNRASWVVPHLSVQIFELRVGGQENPLDVVFLSEMLDSNSSFLNVSVVKVPEGIITSGPVMFLFNISSTNISSVNCSLEIYDASGLGVQNYSFGGISVITSDFNASNGTTYYWNLFCFDYYNNSFNSSLNGSFSVLIIPFSYTYSFTGDRTSIVKQQSVVFSLNYNSTVNISVNYIVNYGDGTGSFAGSSSSRTFSQTFSHTYARTGNFTASMDLIVNSSINSSYILVNVRESGDESKPQITLINPEDGYISNGTSISLSYKAADNVKTENCTLSLFYYPPLSSFFNSSASVVGSKIFNSTIGSVGNNTPITINVNNLASGNYSWRVSCYDSSGNIASSAYRDFSLYSSVFLNSTASFVTQFVDYDGQEEVESLLEDINDFMLQSERYGADEKYVLDALGIIDSLSYYKKKVLQAKGDLQHNLEFLISDSAKETRKREILSDIAEIRKQVPKSIQIKSSDEYTKNSRDASLEDIAKRYFSAKGLILSPRQVNAFAKAQEKLQQLFSTSVSIKQATLIYSNRQDEITLVEKNVKMKNESGDLMVLEVLPQIITSSVTNVSFFVPSSTVENRAIYSVKISDLDDGKLTYLFPRFVSTDDIKKSDTLLLDESISGDLGAITGFASLFKFGGFSYSYVYVFVIALIFLFAVFIFITRISDMSKLKGSEEARTVIQLLEQARNAINQKSFEEAKAVYHEMQQMYPYLSQKAQKLLYGKIEEVRVRIDKTEVSQLVKECLAAIKEGRKGDANMVYKDIASIYSRLPRSYRDKVYNKLSQHFDSLKKS